MLGKVLFDYLRTMSNLKTLVIRDLEIQVQANIGTHIQIPTHFN